MELGIGNLTSRAVDMIFPRRCPVCDRIVVPQGKKICAECSNMFTPIGRVYCLKCGKPLKNEAAEYCKGCRDKEHSYEYCRSAFLYDDVMRKSIYRFKYDGRKEYASLYGEVMYDVLGDVALAMNADAIIPVPMYKKKEKKRGFNQAYLLAKELSDRIKIPVYDNIVIREKSTEIMRSLGAAQRENNIKSAFKFRYNDVKLYDVIIVDDIYTTGNTIDAVAQCLKSNGVRKVYGLCLSTGSTEL